MKKTKEWFFRSAFLASLYLFALRAHAEDATWLAAPNSSDWNTPTNWNPTAAPAGPTGTASFGTSSITTLTFSQDAMIGTLQFINAPSYIFDILDQHRLTITSSGVLSAVSTNAPTFNVSSLADPALVFTSGTAGPAIINVTNTASMEFHGTSSAGQATITAGIATDMTGFQGGFIKFFNNSTAGNATITNLFGSNTEFHDASMRQSLPTLSGSRFSTRRALLVMRRSSPTTAAKRCLDTLMASSSLAARPQLAMRC